MWNSIKDWFKNSETIFLARLTTLSGFITAAVGALDFSPLLNLGLNTGFDKAQVMLIGGVVAAKGLIDEWARRLRTVEVHGTILPSEIVREIKTEITPTSDVPVTTEVTTQKLN